MTSKSLGMLPLALVLSALATIAAMALPAQAVAQDTVYNFSGSCSDCQIQANQLTLQNYTPGSALSASNFVSFTYQSDQLTFTVTQNELDFNTIGIPGTSPFVSGPISTNIGLTGALGATAGPADFYLNAALIEGNVDYSLSFDSCIAVCGNGLTSPGQWQIFTSAMQNSELPGGLATKVNDYGFSHTWTPAAAIAAPEIDAGSAAGAISLLISALAVLCGRRTRPLETIV